MKRKTAALVGMGLATGVTAALLPWAITPLTRILVLYVAGEGLLLWLRRRAKPAAGRTSSPEAFYLVGMGKAFSCFLMALSAAFDRRVLVWLPPALFAACAGGTVALTLNLAHELSRRRAGDPRHAVLAPEPLSPLHLSRPDLPGPLGGWPPPAQRR